MKTTIQILYEEISFDKYANADEVLEDFIFTTRRRGDLSEQVNDVVSFNDFVYKYKLKKKATSNIKNQQVLSTLSFNDVGIYVRDGTFQSDIGIVN